jgi:L-threonylcarbamoyladenylate synthase
MKKMNTTERAIEMLLDGAVGVMPTDTVYGLVARADDQLAVERLYALKHREHKPGTVIAASVNQLIELGVEERYLKKAKQWWPGPLSVETPYNNDAHLLDQDTGHCAWRVVDDARIREILEQTGPLLTSSANQPGQPVAMNVEMAEEYFRDEVDFYVDGGDISNRLPSTVIRVVGDDIEVIRHGAIDIDEPDINYALPMSPMCPFCLANGKLKGAIIFATGDAYLIEASSQPGNYLIIPQLHEETLGRLSDSWWAQLKEILAHVPGLGDDYNVSVNIGKLSGQTVKHIHFWVIPRRDGLPSSGNGLASLIAINDRQPV